MKALITGLIAIAMGFTACKTDTDIRPPQTSVSPFASATMADSIANPLNPFDSIGYQHNLLLYAANNCLQTAKDVASVDGCVIRYAGDLRLDTTRVTMDRQQSFLEDSMNWYRDVLPPVPYNANVKYRIGILVDMIQEAAAEPTLTYLDLKKRLLDFENDVINDVTLTNEQRSLLLQAASIARYSGAYWMNKYPDDPGKPEAHILGWGLGIAADVSSFLTFPHVGFAAQCSAAMSFVGDNFL